MAKKLRKLFSLPGSKSKPEKPEIPEDLKEDHTKGITSKEDSKERITRKLLVAAIDFGTTYSSWACSFYNDYEREPIKVDCKSWNSGTHISLKAPTTVLIQPDGKTIDAFGYDAEDKYAQLMEDKKDKPYYYYQRFKMLLYDNKTLSRNDLLEDTNGKRLPAKTVFSLVIGFLREDLVKEASSKLSSIITENDILWVLTVPAIWNFRAKQFMRECAIEAGIKSKDLLIALEPEAASMYCKHLEIHRNNEVHRNNEGQSDGEMLSAFKPGSQYMIVDAGGGTVDVIVHKVNDDGSLEEVSASSGGDWGGTNVDAAFLKLISEVYGEASIQRLKVEHADDYYELLREIEVKKRKISPGMTSKIVVRMPASLNEMYTADHDENIVEKVKKNSKLNGKIILKPDKIAFNPELMEGVFSETTDQIVDHLRITLSNVSLRETDIILMVGGFSESPMLFGAVDTAFKKYKVMRPVDAGLAVLKGAVIFGHNRKNVKVRVSPYTYGFKQRAEYDPTRYDDSHLYIEVTGEKKVRGAFKRLIEINQRIPSEQETPSKGAVPQSKQTGFSLNLFASKDPDPIYVDDPSCFSVGEVYVDCRDDNGVVCGARISLKFGGTEVEARATLISNGKVTSVTFNFLD